MIELYFPATMLSISIIAQQTHGYLMVLVLQLIALHPVLLTGVYDGVITMFQTVLQIQRLFTFRHPNRKRNSLPMQRISIITVCDFLLFLRTFWDSIRMRGLERTQQMDYTSLYFLNRCSISTTRLCMQVIIKQHRYTHIQLGLQRKPNGPMVTIPRIPAGVLTIPGLVCGLTTTFPTVQQLQPIFITVVQWLYHIRCKGV